MTVKLTKNYFSGTSKVFTADDAGLAAILRGMAIDNTRIYFAANAPTALTDNTTGVANGFTIADIHVPPAVTATASLGEATTNLATSMGKIKNATLVYMNSLNTVRKKLGLQILSYAEGTQASANVLPAQDAAGTGTATLTAVADHASAGSAMRNAKINIRTLADATNDVLAALGQPTLTVAIKSATLSGVKTNPLILQGAISSSADGTNSILVTDVTAYLLSVSAAFATMAAVWNAYVASLEPVTFTDSTGGSAASALIAEPIPAAATGAATTSAPKAGFDTALGNIKNAITSLAYTYNELARQNGYDLITDNSGGTNSATLAAISSTLSAVDGSSGTAAVDVVSATARMTAVRNSLSSLGAVIGPLAVHMDVPGLGADASGGTVSKTLAAITSTATGVGGGSLTTMLNTAVNTWLADVKNNISTLAATLNAMNAQATSIPFNVVAG